MKKQLYILAGMPGSGKTRTADSFVSFLARTVKISSDDIRVMLNGGVYPKGSDYKLLEPVVWTIVEQAITTALNENFNVILDTTALTKDIRQKWITFARERGAIPVIFWHDKNFDSAARWQQERGIDEEEYTAIMQRMTAKIQPPENTEQEGCTCLFLR